MDERQNNHVLLCGAAAAAPGFSHESRGERFYSFPLDVARLSGAVDRLPVVLRGSLMARLPLSPGERVMIIGELRSFNNQSGVGRKLVITVFTREIRSAGQAELENRVTLTGTLCRPPLHRFTPLGREIADLMLAVNRPYGKSDYLPCIAWGCSARRAAAWNQGTRVHILGRLQSRESIKVIDGDSHRRVAYEVSVSEIETAEAVSGPGDRPL